MSRVIRALDFRQPAPQVELASGRVVQTQYFNAVAYQAYLALDAMEGTAAEKFAAFLDVVRLVVPELTLEQLNVECSIEDCRNLIQIGLGNTDFFRRELKNGESGGESPAPPPTPPSNPTT